MAVEVLDLAGDQPAESGANSNTRKRKAPAEPQKDAGLSKVGKKSTTTNASTIDLTQDDEAPPKAVKSKKTNKAKSEKPPDGEKRLRRFRDKRPEGAGYRNVYDRAVNQRMYCLDRTRGGSEECPEETLKIAGSTGNLYTIKINQAPTCDCPHAAKGNECKHVIFALVRVLKAPSHLYYQRAFLKSELREIFQAAPPIVAVDAEKTDNNRKPIGEDDTCPICFMEFEDGQTGTVYCKAACGNNVHKECFDQWAASRRRSDAPVTCPFCRSRWHDGGDPSQIDVKSFSQRQVNADGYVNVAGDLGISTQRDFSTYHSFWVRKQRREGVDVGEWIDPNPSRADRYEYERRYYD